MNYGFADKLPKDDPRRKKFKKQRKRRGFDDTELWSLDYAIIKFTLPRLKAFRKSHCGYPGDLTAKLWNEILDKMIYGLEHYENYNDEKRDEGLDFFFEYFVHLWS